MLAELSEADPTLYDRILIDAPCSNSGVMARRAEARYAQDAIAIASLGRLQDRILNDTANWVRPGGTLVYSTCSIWPDENEKRAHAFLHAHQEFELISERATLPESGEDAANYRDGGYFALMTRR